MAPIAQETERKLAIARAQFTPFYSVSAKSAPDQRAGGLARNE